MTISNHNPRGCQRPIQAPAAHAVPQSPGHPPVQSPASPQAQSAPCARPSLPAPHKDPVAPTKRSALVLKEEALGRRERALEAALLRLEQALAHDAEEGREAATQAAQRADAFLCPRVDAAPAVPTAPVAPAALTTPPAAPSPLVAPSPTMAQFLEPQKVAANAGVNLALGGMFGLVFGLVIAPVVGAFALPAGAAIAFGMVLGGPNWFGARGQ